MNLRIKLYLLLLLFSSIFILFININKNYLSVFLTTTNSSSLHFYDSTKQKIIKNEIRKSFMENRDSILSIINHKFPILIYRYSNENCHSCLVEDLSELNLMKNKIGYDKIVIFPAFEESINNRRLYHNQLANFDYYNFSSNLLLIPTDDSGFVYRYFAIINENGIMEKIFFPKLGNFALTKNYLSEVSKYL